MLFTRGWTKSFVILHNRSEYTKIFLNFFFLYSGLDSQSCSQFVSLMVDLAHNQNRTMVCTLHQPSALMFEKFDQVYALTAGRCIYQGPPNMVIPYFAEYAVVCPSYHNPADFCKYSVEIPLIIYLEMVTIWYTKNKLCAFHPHTTLVFLLWFKV